MQQHSYARCEKSGVIKVSISCVYLLLQPCTAAQAPKQPNHSITFDMLRAYEIAFGQLVLKSNWNRQSRPKSWRTFSLRPPFARIVVII
jgi:hypothetical protein